MARNKCLKCGKEPKRESKHSAYVSEYRVWCPECMQIAISDKSMWTATKLWNAKNKKEDK